MQILEILYWYEKLLVKVKYFLSEYCYFFAVFLFEIRVDEFHYVNTFLEKRPFKIREIRGVLL